MADFSGGRAHVVLEAVRYTFSGDIQALRLLAASRPDPLNLNLVLRILLTYLPAGTEPELYTGFIYDISSSHPRLSTQGPQSPSVFSQQDLSDEDACIRVRRLRLAPLIDQPAQYGHENDPLTLFLLQQAHRIDAETGSLQLISQLLEPFVNHSETLRTWMIGNLLPLLRLDYEYYPHSGPSHALGEFEKLGGHTAVQSLLSKAAQRNDPGDTQNVGRDLRGLVGPWMYGESARKRRKLSQRNRRKSSVTTLARGQQVTQEEKISSEWSYVNDWLLDLSVRDFQRTVNAAVQWDGPIDVDYGDWGNGIQALNKEELQSATRGYAQACLASLYATNESSLETIIGSHRTLVQIARLIGHDEPPDLKRTDEPVLSELTSEYLNDLSPSHFLRSTLLAPSNPLTLPTPESINLCTRILTSCYKLLNLGNSKSNRSVAQLCLFGSETDQLADFRKTLHLLKAKKMDDAVWASIRRQMLWLRHWEQKPKALGKSQGVFSRIAVVDLEKELLRAVLDGGSYVFAVDIYCRSISSPLPMDEVESAVMSAALAAYDSASNGNRNRGGVRKASDIISTFHDYFATSISFKQTDALLSATHAMSFYSLTLQHGVPFQPVNIRAHRDPMSLVGKILSQNSESYTHLDDLLEIGQNLVSAGLAQSSQETPATSPNHNDTVEGSTIARRRITRMAIEAALEEDDFDTAYSYVVNRLSVGDLAKSKAPEGPGSLFAKQDDISWRAAYQAGRYPTNGSGSLALRRLEQRMELLSQALLLAPPSALSEVLAAWQKCEQDMTARITREADEDEKWDEKGDRKVPGGFAVDSSPVMPKTRDPGRGALSEEAPMGLFDVARGAAAALSKSTFPLRNVPRAAPDSPSKSTHGRPLSTASVESSDEGSIGGAGGTGRVRKRDMVSSMVTGGLASGIGWVIGAPPVRQE